MKLCHSLRWKGWYGQRTWTEADWHAAASANEVPWTCVQTGEPWGADDGLVCPEDCQTGRACFVESTRIVKALPVS